MLISGIIKENNSRYTKDDLKQNVQSPQKLAKAFLVLLRKTIVGNQGFSGCLPLIVRCPSELEYCIKKAARKRNSLNIVLRILTAAKTEG